MENWTRPSGSFGHGGIPQDRKAHQRSFLKEPHGYYHTDSDVCMNVCEALSEYPDLDASQIHVHVNDGVVTLSGQVSSKRERSHAEDVIENLSGVHTIVNHLQVF